MMRNSAQRQFLLVRRRSTATTITNNNNTSAAYDGISSSLTKTGMMMHHHHHQKGFSSSSSSSCRRWLSQINGTSTQSPRLVNNDVVNRYHGEGQQQSSSAITTTNTTNTTNPEGGGGDGAAGGGGYGSTDIFLQGEVLDLAADLRTFRPGDKLDIPYELTVSESMQDFWQSAFHAQDRINTSRPFCRKIGLQDRVLPFSLVLFLTSSMTHADTAKVQVGFGNVFYLWPTFAGDTFTKAFTVESIRNTSDGRHSVIHFTCDLINQRGRLCMRADKRMLFDFSVPESSVHAPSPSYITTGNNSNDDSYPTGGGGGGGENVHMFRDHLLSKADMCEELKSHSLVHLRPGQLILHSMQRSLTFTQSQQLASLAKLTHEKHFDCRKYDIGTEILIPGGLVLGITTSASAKDFHEILHEEIINVNYVNELHPGNIVGAISYIQAVDDAVGDLQVVTLRTLGIKNLDVKKDLDGIDVPLELLQPKKGQRFKPKDFEQICKTKCPPLCNKIVVQIDRKILRQAPHQNVFLL